VFFDTNHDIFQKKNFGPLLQDDKIFLGRFPEGYGGESNFSMLVQDSLPIDNYLKMLEFAIF
jgi:hypothetical protein